MATKFCDKDRSRTTQGTANKMRAKHLKVPDEPWVWLSARMLISPAMLTLSLNARRVFDRLLIELAAHGGQTNGKLRVSHRQFRDAGCCNDLIADAIEELAWKGMIRVRRGRGADGTPWPNLYTVTHVGTFDGVAPTNEWQNASQDKCDEWETTKREKRKVKRAEKEARKKNRRSEKSERCRSEKSECSPPNWEVGRA